MVCELKPFDSAQKTLKMLLPGINLLFVESCERLRDNQGEEAASNEHTNL